MPAPRKNSPKWVDYLTKLNRTLRILAHHPEWPVDFDDQMFNVSGIGW